MKLQTCMKMQSHLVKFLPKSKFSPINVLPLHMTIENYLLLAAQQFFRSMSVKELQLKTLRNHNDVSE